MSYTPPSTVTSVVVGTVTQRTKLRSGLLFRLLQCPPDKTNSDADPGPDPMSHSYFLSKSHQDYSRLILLTHKGYKILVNGNKDMSNEKCIQVISIELIEKFTGKMKFQFGGKQYYIFLNGKSGQFSVAIFMSENHKKCSLLKISRSDETGPSYRKKRRQT